jgi:hypothetical protein
VQHIRVCASQRRDANATKQADVVGYRPKNTDRAFWNLTYGLAKPVDHKKITWGKYHVDAVRAAKAWPLGFASDK